MNDVMRYTCETCALDFAVKKKGQISIHNFETKKRAVF